MPPLERARDIHQQAPLDPLDGARASFLLAQALWERREAPERERAISLAEEARSLLVAQKPRGQPELRRLSSWLSRHREARP